MRLCAVNGVRGMSGELWGSDTDVFCEARGLEEVTDVWNTLSEASAVPLNVSIPHYQEYLAKLAEHATTLCLVRDGALVGAASYYANDFRTHRAFLSQFAVASSFKRQGFGRRILEEVCARARACGMESMGLEVAHDNAAARALYGKCGFVFERETGHGSSLMVKDLTAKDPSYRESYWR